MVVSRALGRRHVLVVRRRAAVPRERRHAGRRAGRRTSTPSSSATRTVEIPERCVTNKVTARRSCSAEPLIWGKRLAVFDLDLRAQAAAGGRCVGDHLARCCNTNTVAGRSRRSPRRSRSSTTPWSPTSTPSSAPRPWRCPRPRRRRGRADHRLHQLRPGSTGQGGADRRRREPAGALDRRAVQPGGGVPAGRRHDPRRGGPLHLRQHVARREGHRCPGEGLPGVLGELLQAGHQHRPGADRQRHQRRRPATAPNGTPDYNYDIVAGLDARARPTTSTSPSRSARGSSASRTPAPRSTRPSSSWWRSTTTGSPAAATSRTSATAPVVYNAQVEIRQLLIDWVVANEEIDPAEFAVRRLAAGLERCSDHDHLTAGPVGAPR